MRRAVLVAALLLLPALLLPALPARAAADVPALSAAVDRGVARASADGIRQSVAVLDRGTGQLLVSRGGDEQYISESIVKLFTVAYYEVRAGGHPDDDLAATLRTMIVRSDDRIESQLWNTDIVPAMAARYGLPNTGNGVRTGPHDWGWENITANDEVVFLYRMSRDDEVAPLLMDAMANVDAYGADGFDQHFGLNALTGDHGSKQGWTDVGSETRVQIHSVGWTDRYFVAILQTSTDSDYDTMRADSTFTAQAILASERPAAGTASTTATSTTAPATASATSAATPAAPVESPAQLATAAATIRRTIGDGVARLCALMGV